jgi:hypothetical protein
VRLLLPLTLPLLLPPRCVLLLPRCVLCVGVAYAQDDLFGDDDGYGGNSDEDPFGGGLFD